MQEVKLVNGRGVALVDDQDYATVAEHRWYKVRGYARALVSGRWVYMHRLLMSAGACLEVHHISANRLDNRRLNLACVTHSQNMHGRWQKDKPTASKFRGVTWDKSKQRWQAQAKKDYRQHYLGRFDSEVGAALAYDTFALQHYGGFAAPNLLHRLGSAVTVQLRG